MRGQHESIHMVQWKKYNQTLCTSCSCSQKEIKENQPLGKPFRPMTLEIYPFLPPCITLLNSASLKSFMVTIPTTELPSITGMWRIFNWNLERQCVVRWDEMVWCGIHINQSTNQSINPSTNQWANESMNESIFTHIISRQCLTVSLGEQYIILSTGVIASVTLWLKDASVPEGPWSDRLEVWGDEMSFIKLRRSRAVTIPTISWLESRIRDDDTFMVTKWLMACLIVAVWSTVNVLGGLPTKTCFTDIFDELWMARARRCDDPQVRGDCNHNICTARFPRPLIARIFHEVKQLGGGWGARRQAKLYLFPHFIFKTRFNVQVICLFIISFFTYTHEQLNSQQISSSIVMCWVVIHALQKCFTGFFFGAGQGQHTDNNKQSSWCSTRDQDKSRVGSVNTYQPVRSGQGRWA